jgi:NTE family protein
VKFRHVVTRRQLLTVAAAAAGAHHASATDGPADVSRRRAAPARKPRLAVVLSAGLARGLAHIGVIKALESAGIRPDVIVGCSAGALVGAFWAAGYSGARMESLAQSVRDNEVLDFTAAGSGARYGLATGQALQNFVAKALARRPIETLGVPFFAVATRYPSGELHVFDRGDTGFAVRASCSIPGIFLPATEGDDAFLDGGLVSPLPVKRARALDADVVVAVDVGGSDPAKGAAMGGLYQLLLRSFEIMGDSLRRHEADLADVVIRPSVSRVPGTDFASRPMLVEAGFAAGQRLAPVILERLSRRR